MFPRDEVIVYCKSRDGKYEYYNCNPCNTERLKKYRATPQGRMITNETVYRSVEKHWDKQLARYAVFKAVRRGEIIKPIKCEDCGSKGRLEGHHEDYTKRLEVNWLCKKCHCKRHKK